MSFVSDGFPSNTDSLEDALRRTDFSKYTDLKASLAEKLFKNGESGKKSRPAPLSDEEAELVSAALGLPTEDPWTK